MKSNRYKALLAVILIVILGGATSPYVKLAVEVIPPFTYTFIRFFLAFLLILPIFLKSKPKFKKKDLSLVWLSLFSTFNIILFVFGIRLTLASAGQVIYSFQPIVVAVISYFLLKERITLKKIIGIVIGFLGVNLIILLPLLEKNTFNKEALIGNLMILIGCLLFSYYTTASKKFLEKYSPLWLTISFIFTTAIVSLVFSMKELSSINYWFSNLTPAIIWAIVYVAVIGTVMAYFLQQYVIKKASPLIVSLTQYLTPGVTMVWSNMILGEKFSLSLIIGTAVILYGAWLVTRER
jgi:drug/metabolite transporter (DMT)-like permease